MSWKEDKEMTNKFTKIVLIHMSFHYITNMWNDLKIVVIGTVTSGDLRGIKIACCILSSFSHYIHLFLNCYILYFNIIILFNF